MAEGAGHPAWARVTLAVSDVWLWSLPRPELHGLHWARHTVDRGEEVNAGE